MSSTLRVMHAGDLLLDGQFPFEWSLDADDRYILQDATLKACEKLLYLSLQEQVDLLLITGNIFADDRPTLRACLSFQELCTELLKDGVHILIAGPDQSVCELPDVRPFIPERVEYLPLKQGTWKKDLGQGEILQVGYRPTTSSDQRIWQIGLVEGRGSNTHWDQCFQDNHIIYIPVGDATNETGPIEVSISDPIQPVIYREAGRPFIHLLETTGQGWELKKQQTAVLELRKKKIELESFGTWDHLIHKFQTRMNEEDFTGLDTVLFRWKIIGTGELLESLLEPKRVDNLREDLKRISPSFPRCLHEVDVIPIRKYRPGEPTELEEIYHACLFGEINTVGSNEPFTLPGLSSNMEDFVTQVVNVDTETLDESHLFEQALKKGHLWLR